MTLSLAAPAFPQTPAFDVVSVKPNPTAQGGGWPSHLENGRWKATISLSSLITTAFALRRGQLFNLPAWAGAEYDIVGISSADDRSPQRLRQMLQSLLADKFQLAIHHERRNIPVLVLGLAKGGSKITTAAGGCLPAKCGVVDLIGNFDAQGNDLGETWQGQSISLDDFMKAVSANLPVVNETGVEGLFDIAVHSQAGSPPGIERGTREYADWLDDREAAAFQSQLGLLFNPSKVVRRPTDVIVIDHLARPAPN